MRLISRLRDHELDEAIMKFSFSPKASEPLMIIALVHCCIRGCKLEYSLLINYNSFKKVNFPSSTIGLPWGLQESQDKCSSLSINLCWYLQLKFIIIGLLLKFSDSTFVSLFWHGKNFISNTTNIIAHLLYPTYTYNSSGWQHID